MEGQGLFFFLESIIPWEKYEAKEEKETERGILCITWVIHPAITNDCQIAKEARYE